MTSKSFTGGEALEKRLAEMAANLEKGAAVRVGWPGPSDPGESADGEDKKGATEPNGALTAAVAFMQEFGAPRAGIPPRPFFRTMIADKSPTWGDRVAAGLKASDFDSEKALGLVGLSIAEDLQESIRDLDEPPLSAVTLMLRSLYPVRSEGVTSKRQVVEARMLVELGESPGPVSTKPLIWTHQMINSVTAVVETK